MSSIALTGRQARSIRLMRRLLAGTAFAASLLGILTAPAVGQDSGPDADAGTTSRSVAIGYRARATEPGTVAIGNNSLADAANTVSVGHAGGERRVVNVATGVGPTDAVNLAQVQAMLSAAAVPALRGSRPAIGAGTAGGPAIAKGGLPGPRQQPTARSALLQPAGVASAPGGRTGDGELARADALEPSTIVGWANVNRDGTLSAARNIAGNARHGIGDYEIAFRKIAPGRCTYSATLAGVGFVAVKAGPEANSLKVETRNHYGVLTDLSFYLMAVC
jgi:autotransporter adhesin